MIFPLITLLKVAKSIKQRIREDGDAVVCISGVEGIGKSVLAIILSYLVYKDFDLDDNMLYAPNEEEWKDKVNRFKKGSVFNLDEAVKLLEKQNWAKQTFIKKMFQVIRGKNFITFLLIPRVEDLNEYFRNWRVMLNICVVYRGWAYLQTPDAYNKFDVWHRKYNQEQLDYAIGEGETLKTANEGKVMLAISRFKGFAGFVNFPDLPKEIKEEYKSNKAKYSMSNMENKEEEEDNSKVHPKRLKALERNTEVLKDLILIVNKEFGLNQKEISKKLGISKNTLKYIIGTIK